MLMVDNESVSSSLIISPVALALVVGMVLVVHMKYFELIYSSISNSINHFIT